AEDLVQETLLRVRRGLRTYKPGSMEAWLTRIATNAFIDRVRRRRRRPETLLPDGPAELATNATAAAEDDYIGASLSRDVQAALDDLPVEYRLAVVLCDISGLSYEQAAEALAVPVGTVRSRLHRGRAALRKALA
ncbi:MAG TPA: sigma-70 family RNA polymerase sigma factor, partial [Acidimicrobiales bacterium]|nr:sigma-70 family RNA polymerase sigma factor [Acidimicrobiales bacterium]